MSSPPAKRKKLLSASSRRVGGDRQTTLFESWEKGSCRQLKATGDKELVRVMEGNVCKNDSEQFDW